MFLLSDILYIQYESKDPTKFEDALQNGETEVIVVLKSGETINATKPILVAKDDGYPVYLKIPNPCNHKPEIAYIEAAVATCTRDLLSTKEVYVPAYEVIHLPLNEGGSTPCCLIEALENFKSFGRCGDDFVAFVPQTTMMTEEKKQVRERQLGIIDKKSFAAYSVLMYFISNNDPHQENFGTAQVFGKETLAAIDFDMTLMQLLIDRGIFGPYNADFFTRESGYHHQDGGRFTPNIDTQQFPVLSPDSAKTPDNWITNYIHSFLQGLEARKVSSVFREAVKGMFAELLALPIMFFHTSISKVLTKQMRAKNPQLQELYDALISYFADRIHSLEHNLHSQQKTPHFRSPGETDTGPESPSIGTPYPPTPIRGFTSTKEGLSPEDGMGASFPPPSATVRPIRKPTPQPVGAGRHSVFDDIQRTLFEDDAGSPRPATPGE